MLACVFELKLFSIFCYANLNRKKAVGQSLENFAGLVAGAGYVVRNINKTYEFLRKVDNRINHGCWGKFLLNKKFLLCLGPRTLISEAINQNSFQPLLSSSIKSTKFWVSRPFPSQGMDAQSKHSRKGLVKR